jgi:CheY-like chemotaxis protein
MDMQMPVMDGLEATKKIRAHEAQSKSAKQVPIVGLSAYARAEFAQQAQNAGMNAYLTKPYEKKEIYRVINECLASYPDSSPHSRCAKSEAMLTPSCLTEKNFVTKVFGDIESISRHVVGSYQGNDIVFDVFHTKADGSCGFYCLPIPYDRSGVVLLLKGHLNNAHIRALIAVEIMESLKLNYLPASFYHSFPQLSEFKFYQSGIDIAQAQLLQKALDHIDPSRTSIVNRQFELVVNYLQRKADRSLEENSLLEQMLKFQQD